MSQQVFIPHPKRQHCIDKVGMPSWWGGDPMTWITQGNHPSDEKIMAYNECLNSSHDNQYTDSKTTSVLILVIIVIAILGMFIFFKR